VSVNVQQVKVPAAEAVQTTSSFTMTSPLVLSVPQTWVTVSSVSVTVDASRTGQYELDFSALAQQGGTAYVRYLVDGNPGANVGNPSAAPSRRRSGSPAIPTTPAGRS